MGPPVAMTGWRRARRRVGRHARHGAGEASGSAYATPRRKSELRTDADDCRHELFGTVTTISGTNSIEVQPLVREVKKGPRAVDGIDLSVAPGEIYVFLGPNGAGKSTTVLMLTTLLPPTSGRASVGGFDIVRQGSQVRASIGAALQEAALDAILTGREHLMLQATLQGIPGAVRKQSAQELLERVGLTEAADRRVGGYSGGMKRRLDLALALVHSPRILFLDEPTTGLDVQSRTALWEEVA